MKESDLQVQVADYLRLRYPNVLFHSDFGSGIKLTQGQAMKQKRQNGGRRGWPDMFIAEPRYAEVEQWDAIRGYEGLYEISDHGRVKRIDKNGEHLIKAQVNSRNGYCYVHLSKENTVRAHRVHRLVAEHFIKNPYGKKVVNHIDGNKQNNMYSNLEWATDSENQLHSHRVLGNVGGRKPKKVKCVETGEIYSTMAEASRKTGIKHIASVIRGERQTAGGYKWQEL